MPASQIAQIIILIILAAYVIADAIVKIIKRIKGEDEIEWKAQLSFCADLIEKGIKIPDDILVKLLRNKLSSKEYTKFVKSINK